MKLQVYLRDGKLNISGGSKVQKRVAASFAASQPFGAVICDAFYIAITRINRHNIIYTATESVLQCKYN